MKTPATFALRTRAFKLGHIPTVVLSDEAMGSVNQDVKASYKHLNFDQIEAGM